MQTEITVPFVERVEIPSSEELFLETQRATTEANKSDLNTDKLFNLEAMEDGASKDTDLTRPKWVYSCGTGDVFEMQED